jgi:O-succinylbenzoic acid--CoA ligase
MAEALSALLKQRWGEDWLIGLSNQQFWDGVAQLRQQLLSHRGKYSARSTLLINTADPLKILVTLFAAWDVGCSVFLANPAWGQHEWRQIQALLGLTQPFTEEEHHGFWWCHLSVKNNSPWIGIPTGGSSGKLRFVIHTWDTLTGSAEGFMSHFEVTTVHAYCVLPLFHVSGLMQAIRVFVSGGKLAIQPYRQLKQGQWLVMPADGFLSLVPTQLQWLLQQGEGYSIWLTRFRAVLLGGAPPWPELLVQARQANIPLALTYGMTETASQVATLLPEQFLSGHTSMGIPLPHAEIHILDDGVTPKQAVLTGQILVKANSLALGYLSSNSIPMAQGWEFIPLQKPFMADDIGYLDQAGFLHVIGRHSTKLISGGENVFPEEVEAVLLSTGLVEDACVVGLPDQQWGQQLCAVVVLHKGGLLSQLDGYLRSQLAAYKLPKRWIAITTLPRTPQGKLNRRQVLSLAQKALGIDDVDSHSL